ncbi:hypothetical protein EMCRGX_G028688 [Ephydatia muelleri]
MASLTTNGRYPPFALGKSKYDQSTFVGRLKHFLDVVDPRTLLTTERQLREAVRLLRDFEEGRTGPEITSQQLWEAQKIKQAIIHPDTDKKIFMPFRMSGFVPFGTITVVGLLLPNQTFPQMIFWQWLNQTHNACVNYANRNATKATPTSKFIQGYIGAVSAAVGIAVLLSALVKRAQAFQPTTKMLIQRFVPFPAVATANIINVFLMRNHELKEGIAVTDAEGREVGFSVIAAKKAVTETAITRAILPAPILVIPPLIMTQLEKTNLFKARPRLYLPVQVVICVACFAIALPVTIALFPQTREISVSKLETQLQSKTTSSVVYYNKGL